MFLKKLMVTNFKNYPSAELEFSGKLNCFVGENGAGKTNLLDAMYYLSFTKSFLNPADYQNILNGEDFFRLQGNYVSEEGKTDIVECIQQRGHRKIVRFNKKEYERLSDHIGLIPLVMVSPADTELIHDGSEERRKYVDSVISQFDKVYLDNLIQYNKALLQRNRLLKHFAETRTFDAAALEIWNAQLIRFGIKIFEKRQEFIRTFIPVFQKYFERISQGKETVQIEYESQLNSGTMPELLENSLAADRASGYTTTGIHKDDVVFMIRGYPLKKFGSQGQQKTYLIAVKLAQFDYTQNIKGFKPIMLFDDLFDKLDDLRVEQLMRLVCDENFGQIFITDTSKERILKIIHKIGTEYTLYNIHNGSAKHENIARL